MGRGGRKKVNWFEVVERRRKRAQSKAPAKPKASPVKVNPVDDGRTREQLMASITENFLTFPRTGGGGRESAIPKPKYGSCW